MLILGLISQTLCEYAEKGDYESVKRWVEVKKEDVNTKCSEDGETPLHLAAKGGHLRIAKFLVEKGADVKAKNNDGWTPLYAAAKGGHIEVVKYLVGEYIKRGYDNERFANGGTLLHFAAYGGDLKQVKYLISKGADVKAKGNAGETPLHWAAYGGNIQVVKYLVEKGADVKAKDIDGNTPCDLTVSEEIKAAMGYCKR